MNSRIHQEVKESPESSLRREVKFIRERLAYIGRYMQGISPKLQRYQELEKEKTELRRKLKEINKEDI